MTTIPAHLKKYIVDQDYSRYTPIDHAVWRFVLRQLRNYLSKHAHEFYLEGLEKTGIDVESIPSIESISENLKAFGWQAFPVSGFIPPAAFMELQAHSILPIASDMRSIDHLLYTPAPDIVHEAAGHAPMLAHPEYAAYLKKYAQVAKKAIISKEDLDLYEAIRHLSDIKESPLSKSEEIEAAEKRLVKTSNSMSHISEASLLSRMNWWTAEYGLIGDIQNPKILGAGLLSSVGESISCLSDKVKKLPLTVDCIDVSYDITERQPQLFVAPDFKTLSIVLEQLADKMAFRLGGKPGLQRALQAKSVNTVELNSGIQISSVLVESIENSENIAYLRFDGRTQLSYQDAQLPGHGPDYHAHGFGTPIGSLKAFPQICPSTLKTSELEKAGIKTGEVVTLEFVSGVKVKGLLTAILRKAEKNLLFSFENCTVTCQNRTLFEPAWGTFDMAVGTSVASVFGGPADRISYGEVDDFVAPRILRPEFSDREKKLHALYQEVRNVRSKGTQGVALETALRPIAMTLNKEFTDEWLLRLEIYELLFNQHQSDLKSQTLEELLAIKKRLPEVASTLEDGLRLAPTL